ncbi:type II secretion system minor pseudopilin GspI [Luteimonas soli]|uniref:Type II secretion system protein I n=1 Tax=Luteimonas soli TaxID=1648966 RepID=A0ABV7XMU9_9GAMM
MCRADRSAPARGFSLIEMLVAVAVLSLIALALLNLAGENTRTALVVEERVLAGIVADNRAVEAMLAAPGELSAHAEGSEPAGDREWRWSRNVSSTDMDAIVRVDVTVMAPGEERIAAEASVFRSAR